MSSHFNQKILDLLSKYNSKDTSILIQKLFDIYGETERIDDRKTVQKCILTGMEQIHEWNNILEYINKWQMFDFQKEFISRMKRRVD